MTEKAVAAKAVSNWCVVAMLLIAALFTGLLVHFANAPGLVGIAIFLALIVATLLKQRWVIYATVAIALFAVSNRPRGFATPGLSLFALYFVIILMGYMIFSLRFTDLEFRFRCRPRISLAPPTDANRMNTLHSLRPLTSGWLWLPLAIAIAHVIMWIVPLDASTDYRLAIRPAGFRAISTLWYLSVLWFLASGVFWLIADREKDPVRARVLVRSVLCREWHGEWHRIAKRRARKKRKQVPARGEESNAYRNQ